MSRRLLRPAGYLVKVAADISGHEALDCAIGVVLDGKDPLALDDTVVRHAVDGGKIGVGGLVRLASSVDALADEEGELVVVDGRCSAGPATPGVRAAAGVKLAASGLSDEAAVGASERRPTRAGGGTGVSPGMKH